MPSCARLPRAIISAVFEWHRIRRPDPSTDQAFLLALTERLAEFAVPQWRTRAEN